MEITATTATAATQQLADRYIAVWNEPDPTVRRTLIAELWSPEAVHLVQPPQEMRERAIGIGFPDAALELRGHAALEVRVRTAYQEFVASGQMRFRARPDADRLQSVVKFHWEAVDPNTEQVVGGGLEFVVLDEDGRIARDYQFISSRPVASALHGPALAG
ncbi:hypothetical protein [Kitasatospora azatica]|uniref:hypothetical protein n=1 Tax=Kitasatospora azatica TaxID=58347 RepID=UPI00068EBD5D|nr:hypothetical protein [Kitasatospora azatica]